VGVSKFFEGYGFDVARLAFEVSLDGQLDLVFAFVGNQKKAPPKRGFKVLLWG